MQADSSSPRPFFYIFYSSLFFVLLQFDYYGSCGYKNTEHVHVLCRVAPTTEYVSITSLICYGGSRAVIKRKKAVGAIVKLPTMKRPPPRLFDVPL